MKKKIERWLANKKNRQTLFFLIGVICVYFYVRSKSKAGATYAGAGSYGTNPTLPLPTRDAPNDVIPISGTMSPKVVSTGDPAAMLIERTGTSKNWWYKDLTVVQPEDGYEIVYWLNNSETIRGQQLNYNFKSNMPLDIIKMKVKIGVTDLYNYHGHQGSDESLGRAFSDNNTAGYTKIIHNRY